MARAKKKRRNYQGAVKACVKLGLDTTASQLAHCMRNAVGPTTAASKKAVDRAAERAWKKKHPRKGLGRRKRR